MLLLPFLYDRQIGSIRKVQSSDRKPNLDCLLSRLVCGLKDVYVTWGESRVPVPPFSCKFRKDKESDLLAVANEDGEIYLIDTERSNTVKNFTAHNNAIFDLCWLPDKNRLLTAAGDFRSCLFDMETCRRVSTYQFHSASIKSIDVCQGENGMLFAAGSKDGDISVWDIRENCQSLHSKPAIIIDKAHSRTTYNTNKRTLNSASSSSSVSAVAFKDCNTLASAGVADGVIKIWDLRKTYFTNRGDRQHQSRYQIKYLDPKVQGFGFTNLVFNSLYTKLYACSTANKIFEVDCHSYTKKSAQFTGLKCSTYFIKMSLSYDDQYLVSGSSDNKAYIWKTSKPGQPIFELPGHTAEVTSVAFGAYDNAKIATCGDDNKVFLWKTKYTDDANYKYDKEVVAASCPYSNDIVDDSSHSIGDTISIFQSVTLVKPTKDTPKFKSPPGPRDIKNFFSPLRPAPSQPTPNKTLPSNEASTPTTNQNNKASTSTTNQNKASSSTINQYKASPPLTNQNNKASPPATNQSNEVSPPPTNQSGPSIQNEASSPAIRLPLSPRKNLQGSSTNGEVYTPQSSNGKENGSGSKPNGQMKRKLNLNDRFCKRHPDGCGRTRGHTRCGKRITIVPEKMNLKNYFFVTPEK